MEAKQKIYIPSMEGIYDGRCIIEGSLDVPADVEQLLKDCGIWKVGNHYGKVISLGMCTEALRFMMRENLEKAAHLKRYADTFINHLAKSRAAKCGHFPTRVRDDLEAALKRDSPKRKRDDDDDSDDGLKKSGKKNAQPVAQGVAVLETPTNAKSEPKTKGLLKLLELAELEEYVEEADRFCVRKRMKSIAELGEDEDIQEFVQDLALSKAEAKRFTKQIERLLDKA